MSIHGKWKNSPAAILCGLFLAPGRAKPENIKMHFIPYKREHKQFSNVLFKGS